MFHSPNYRSRYAEFLKTDFPRLPLTGNSKLFHSLARLGAELTDQHLLKTKGVKQSNAIYIGTNRAISKVGWTPDNGGTVWIDGKGSARNFQSGTAGFSPVSEKLWNFHIGSYQVCQKWLKDRGPKKGNPGHTLTNDDIAHYLNISTAISETIGLMSKVDKVIDDHGGWPAAFAI